MRLIVFDATFLYIEKAYYEEADEDSSKNDALMTLLYAFSSSLPTVPLSNKSSNLEGSEWPKRGMIVVAMNARP